MRSALFKRRDLVLAAASMLLAGPALSRENHRPNNLAHDGGASPRATHWAGHRHRHAAPHSTRHFEERHYTVVRKYYRREWHAGRHPPGWGHRHHHQYDHWKYRHHGHFNHHGHFKPWRLGYPLHHSVIYDEVPAQVVTYLGPPRYGHRYVQVAGDILLIAIGTALVADALEDLIDWR